MYDYRVLVCDLLNAPETYFVVLQVCLPPFCVWCATFIISHRLFEVVLPFLQVILISWQCAVSSMGAAMCMMCNI